MIALKALNFFGDLDPNIDPPKMKTEISLDAIKKRIEKATLKPEMIFKGDVSPGPE